MTNRELVDAAWAEIEQGLSAAQDLTGQARAELEQSLGAAKALLDQVTDAPVEVPEGPRAYGVKAIFDINRGSYPERFKGMNLDCIEAYQNPTGADYQLVRSGTGLDTVEEGHTAWVWMGGFAADKNGGYMKLDDDKLRRVFAYEGDLGYTVPDHPQNSHYYMLLDEDQIATISNTPYTEEERNRCLATIADRRDLLHELDPQAVCIAVESNETRLGWYSDETLGRPICDYLLLDGYPNYSEAQGGYLEDRIPNQAAWAEAAGKPYGFCVSYHAYGNGAPEYPDPETFNHSMDQIDQTDAEDIFVYVWDDGDSPSLHEDPDGQAAIGERFA